MKVIVIAGSLRQGNTYTMAKVAHDALIQSNIQSTFVHLKDIDLLFCNGCLACDKTEECFQKDDMNALVACAKTADAFVFATPTRWSLLSAELKAFMDRLNPLASKELLMGKMAVVFAVGQTDSGEDKSISTAANSVVSFCDNAGIEVVDIVIADNCLESGDVAKRKDVLECCRRAASKLAATNV